MPTFTGGRQHDSSDWTNGDNWDSGEPPKDGDDVTITDNPDWASPVYPGGDLSVKNLTLGRQTLIMTGGTITCTGAFTLSGTIADGGTIRIAGTGSITCGTGDRIPSIGNSTALDVTGTLYVQGPGTFAVGGGQCKITNSGTLIFANSTLNWVAGANPIIENKGVVSVAGTGILAGGDIRNHGSVSISSGSTLVVSTSCVLRQFAKGRVKGPGTLVVGEPLGYGATLSIEGNTILPKDLRLELTDNGSVLTPDAITPPPTLQILGALIVQNGLLNARTTLAVGATCTFTGADGSLWGGTFQNLGTITVVAGKRMNLSSGIDFVNSGRMSLSGGTAVLYQGGTVRFRNPGLLMAAGSKPNAFSSITIENTGNIVVKEGTLSLAGGATINMAGGVLDLVGTKIICPDGGGGSVSLSKGTLGGVLRGHGTIKAPLVNRGVAEPHGTGLTVEGNYEQDSDGALVVTQPVDNAHPPLVVTGTATLDGSLFIRG